MEQERCLFCGAAADLTHDCPAATAPYFDGETYEPEHDEARLTGQLLRVYTLMRDGQWRGLSEISCEADCSEASASARLRDLRKARFGGLTVERQRLDGGLFRYRLTR